MKKIILVLVVMSLPVSNSWATCSIVLEDTSQLIAREADQVIKASFPKEKFNVVYASEDSLSKGQASIKVKLVEGAYSYNRTLFFAPKEKSDIEVQVEKCVDDGCEVILDEPISAEAKNTLTERARPRAAKKALRKLMADEKFEDAVKDCAFSN